MLSITQQLQNPFCTLDASLRMIRIAIPDQTGLLMSNILSPTVACTSCFTGRNAEESPKQHKLSVGQFLSNSCHYSWGHVMEQKSLYYLWHLHRTPLYCSRLLCAPCKCSAVLCNLFQIAMFLGCTSAVQIVSLKWFRDVLCYFWPSSQLSAG